MDFWHEWRFEPLGHGVYEDQHFGVQHMDDTEVEQSIIEDLLTLLGHGIGGIYWHDFFRLMRSNRQRERVLSALIRLLGSGMIVEHGKFLSLDFRHESLQFVMDFAGYWLNGFAPPDGTTVLRLTDQGEEMLEVMGVSGVAQFLSAAMICPNSTDTMQ